MSQSNRENSQLVGQGSWGPGTTWWAIRGLPAWLLGCEQPGEEKKEGMGDLSPVCRISSICTDWHGANFVHTVKRQEL